ncbi:unnamed protein product [Urochloa decumbens]|uniref:F-box domain-containing protein n=1 Tax=Urochloa decumbens TaxID=240449 RepID=A0ABC9AKX7_9POAL
MDAAVYPDWSGLPEDLTAMVMRRLDIPNLFRAGTICTAWYAAYSAVRRVRIPIKDSSPCLLYSCAGDDPDIATLYSPTAGTTFKVRLPAPAFRTRHVLGGGHGWVVTADEASSLQALNPLTGTQVDLPPATGLHHIESSTDEQGRPVYSVYDKLYPDTPGLYAPRELRMYLYHRVVLSCSPSAGRDCIVLLLHEQHGEMSYDARLGDGRCTLVTGNETVPWNFGYRTAAYNKDDGFCIAFAPWDDTLHVSRHTLLRTLTDPVQVPQEHAREVINPCLESYTDEMELYKVDIDGGKLAKIRGLDLLRHALFLGFNSSILHSTKDNLPRLKPNCAYLADDNWEQIGINMFGCRDLGIRNFETYKNT